MIVVRRKGEPTVKYCASETMEKAIEEILKTVCKQEDIKQYEANAPVFLDDVPCLEMTLKCAANTWNNIRTGPNGVSFSNPNGIPPLQMIPNDSVKKE